MKANSLGDWLVTTLLTVIPIVGIIMLFLWSFFLNTTEAKRNYARAMLLWQLIGIVVMLIFGTTLISALF